MIMSKKSFIGLSVALLTTSSAFAQQHVPYGIYVGAMVGESDFEVGQASATYANWYPPNEPDLTKSGTSAFKPMYGLSFGYAHPSWPMRFEVQYQYHNNLNFNTTFNPNLGTGEDYGSIPIYSKITSQALMFNAYFDWQSKYSTFMPYFMLGIGMSRNSIKLTYNPIYTKYPPGEGQDSNVSFAWQLGVGARIRVLDHLFVDIGAQMINLGASIARVTGPDSNQLYMRSNRLDAIQGTIGLHFFFGDQSKPLPGLINDDVD